MAKARRKLPREHEAALIAGCQRGDSDCWQQLFVQYRQDAWRILYKMLGPVSDLEDLVQQVFMKVHRSMVSFEGRSRFSTWLYRICVHVAMDHLRQKKRRREVLDDEAANMLVDPQADPAARVAQKEAAQMLNQALAKLKEEKRNVIVLHDLMEITAEDIALSLNIPSATVRTRLFYARRELAKILAKQKGRPKP